MYVAGLGTILPTWSGDFVDVHQELINRQWLEVMVAALPRKVLDTLNGVSAVSGGANDDFETALHVGLFCFPHHQFRAAENTGKRVVEVVGYARGQLAQRRHLLNL